LEHNFILEGHLISTEIPGGFLIENFA